MLTLKCYIDFDGNLGFSAANEDVSAQTLSFKTERSDDINGEGGYVQLVLSNTTGEFVPQSTLSPYGDDFRIGRRVKVTAIPDDEPTVDELDSVTWDRLFCTPDGFEFDLIYVFITSITPDLVASQPSRHTAVQARALTYLLKLRNFKTGTLQDKKTGDIIDMVLDTLGASSPSYFVWGVSRWGVDTIWGGSGASWRDIDTGRNTLPYCSFNDSALAALKELLNQEQGHFYIRRDGWSVFEDRHHRMRARTSLFTFDDSHIAALVTEYDDSQLYNHVDVVAHPRSVGVADSIMWDALGSSNGYAIASGESGEYGVSFSDPDTGESCEATAIVDPLIASTDYLANSAADGSGDDRTADIAVVLTITDTGSYICTVTNNGSEQIYLTKLQVRGTPLVAYDAVIKTAEDTAAIARDLQRDLEVDYMLLSDPVYAENLAKFLLNKHKEPRLRVKNMSIVGNTSENLLQIMFREVGDRIAIESDKFGISGEFIIRGISLQSDGKLEKLSATYNLEQAPSNYFVWGVSRWGVDTIWAY